MSVTDLGPATPGMRDHGIAASISACEDEAVKLSDLLGRLHDHAETAGADEHAELYDQVQGCLSSAAKQLGRAHDIMLNGGGGDGS